MVKVYLPDAYHGWLGSGGLAYFSTFGDLIGESLAGLIVVISAVVREGSAFQTMLLEALVAGTAMLARVDHKLYSDSVPHPESGDRTTHFSYPSCYLVARNYRVVRIASVPIASPWAHEMAIQYPHRALVPPRVRVVVDYLLDALKSNEVLHVPLESLAAYSV